jgi:transcriptional regulator with XRE-family HTH domain
MRHDVGATQADVAERAGVSTATISRLENSLAWPTTDAIDRICDTYCTMHAVTRYQFAEMLVETWRRDLNEDT